MAVRSALEGASAAGAKTELIDLRHYNLIFCNGSIPDNEAPPDALKLRQTVRQADGVILGTPE